MTESGADAEREINLSAMLSTAASYGMMPSEFWSLRPWEFWAFCRGHEWAGQRRMEEYEALAIMTGIAQRAKQIPKVGSMVKRRGPEMQPMKRDSAEAIKARLKRQRRSLTLGTT